MTGIGRASLLSALAATWVGCATYEQTLSPQASSLGAAGVAGSVDSAGSGGLAASGAAGMQSPSLSGASSSGNDGPAGAASGGDTCSSGSAGSAGSAGTGGNAGVDGGPAGSGGSAGTSSAGAAGSGVIVDQLLSQGKTASADSTEMGGGHPASHGNDGSVTTRWCAVDSALGHNWQVDLGAIYTLGKLQINWEKAALYQFKVEGSSNSSNWFTLLDQTKSTSSNADQSYVLTAGPTVRWVKLTVTGLPNTNTWASFFEFAVYGH